MSYIVDGKFVIDGVVRKLVESFPSITVYDEKTNQNIKKPSFFVYQLRLKQEKQLREKYQRKYNIVIRYHATSDMVTSYNNFNDVESTLFEKLTTIICGYVPATEDEPEVPGVLVRGTEMSSREEDNILHFFVSYTIDMKKPKNPVVKMGTLQTTVTT